MDKITIPIAHNISQNNLDKHIQCGNQSDETCKNINKLMGAAPKLELPVLYSFLNPA